ncbi:hypothetical protein BDN71DRAFT_1448565 [Pleurotus eryngii]|uniref:Pheromone n=1 Tax=Pleurotus eryngii TaxID=5323 RepID=A0A9P6D821_PLEER|nr:hypothetical protein BDN71DRAFT_1448565 [Pleurotus eryngii]
MDQPFNRGMWLVQISTIATPHRTNFTSHSPSFHLRLSSTFMDEFEVLDLDLLDSTSSASRDQNSSSELQTICSAFSENADTSVPSDFERRGGANFWCIIS